MKISIIGTGYVGLVTGTCLAESGNDVLCVDTDKAKIDSMKLGNIPIYEPNLDVFFTRNIKEKRLNFTTSLEEGISHGQIIFLALPTPDTGSGEADLSYVLKVAEDIGKCIKEYKVIVNKSTVPVGTSEKVLKTIRKFTDIEVDVISNPEFLKEGVAVEDFMKPERIIIGTTSQKAINLMQKLYRPFVRSGNAIIIMDEKSAELTKYAANAFLATKISFMNEIANLCDKLGANVDAVRYGIGSDSRIGKRFLFPGIGFGGSCFPKDINALYHIGKQSGYNLKILEAVIGINQIQRLILIPKIEAYFKTLKDKKIAIWGLSFKPETDDIREAPSVYMIDSLISKGAHLQAFDPEAMPNINKKYGDKITLKDSMYDILRDADALVICTEWSVFRTPDFERLKALMKSPVIFDGRNLYDTENMKDEGFYYLSIGRS